MPLTHVHHEAVKARKPRKVAVKQNKSAPAPRPNRRAAAPTPPAQVSPPPTAAPEEPVGTIEAAPEAPPATNDSPAQAPEDAGQGFAASDFKSRIDAAQSRIASQQQDDALQELLDHAVTLLETVSRHPALADYNANKRKLDEIEQRLAYGAYPQ